MFNRSLLWVFMTRVIISDCGKRFIIVRWLCLPRLKRKEEDKAVKFLVKHWRKGQRNKLELAFFGLLSQTWCKLRICKEDNRARLWLNMWWGESRRISRQSSNHQRRNHL